MGHHEIGFRRVLQHTLKAAMHSRQQNSSSLSMAVPNVLGTTGLPDMRPKDIPHAGTAGVRRACSVLVEFYEVERSSEFRRNWNMAGFDNTQIASCQRMRQCDDYPIHTFLIYHGFHGVSLGGSQHLFVELCSCTLSSHQTEDQTTIPGIQAPNFLQRQAAPNSRAARYSSLSPKIAHLSRKAFTSLTEPDLTSASAPHHDIRLETDLRLRCCKRVSDSRGCSVAKCSDWGLRMHGLDNAFRCGKGH
jgi:hypothetical protein